MNKFTFCCRWINSSDKHFTYKKIKYSQKYKDNIQIIKEILVSFTFDVGTPTSKVIVNFKFGF